MFLKVFGLLVCTAFQHLTQKVTGQELKIESMSSNFNSVYITCSSRIISLSNQEYKYINLCTFGSLNVIMPATCI